MVQGNMINALMSDPDMLAQGSPKPMKQPNPTRIHNSRPVKIFSR